MKKLLIGLFSLLPLISFAQNVDFFQGTWEEANAKAKAENKLIMVDAYTYWCGPCKMMDKTMFHDNKEVADYINKHFVAYKVECEHDAGVAFARKYKVNVYPTTLFFNSNGQLLEKHLGYNSDQKEFLAGYEKVVNMDKQDVFNMDATKMVMPWPDFYVKYFKDANDSTWKRDRTVDANGWLDQQTDYFSETVWAVMYVFTLNDKYNQFFLDNYAQYKKLYKFEATDKINNIIYGYMNAAVKEKKPELMQKAETEMQKYFPDDNEGLFYLRYNYYQQLGDYKSLADMLQKRIESGVEVSLGLINDLAWTLYEKSDDSGVLDQAIRWFDPHLANINDYNAMDTYAALLYKVGRYNDAKTWAEKAIAQGKADKMDVQGTEDLLERINKELN